MLAANQGRWNWKRWSNCFPAAAVLLMGAVVPGEASLLAGVPDRTGDDPPEAVTYARDIAPILQENCQLCHQAGGIGPMSLTSYEEVRPWAPMIKYQVQTREMPPYHYDPHVGIQQLKGDWRLTVEEIATVAAWVDAGAPMGDQADLPPARDSAIPLDWKLRNPMGRAPDVVIRSEPFSVPAESGDIWWQPIVDSGVEEDRWIRALEVRPTTVPGSQVAHHANPYMMVYDEDEGEWVRQSVFTEYAMGKVGEIIPTDAARRIPAGARVAWDIHYYPSGQDVPDDVIELGLWLEDKDYEPRFEQTLRLYPLDGDLTIPPHGTAMTQGFHSWGHPVRIDSFQPHGHNRLHAKSMEIFHPDRNQTDGRMTDSMGERELLSLVRPFRSTWHHSYMFEDDVAPLVPQGSVVIWTAWYDNTANNPLNPDPNMWVYRGSRTTDEMSHAWVAITHLDEEGYQEILAEREALTREHEEFAGDDD